MTASRRNSIFPALSCMCDAYLCNTGCMLKLPCTDSWLSIIEYWISSLAAAKNLTSLYAISRSHPGYRFRPFSAAWTSPCHRSPLSINA